MAHLIRRTRQALRLHLPPYIDAKDAGVKLYRSILSRCLRRTIINTYRPRDRFAGEWLFGQIIIQNRRFGHKSESEH